MMEVVEEECSGGWSQVDGEDRGAESKWNLLQDWWVVHNLLAAGMR